MRQKRLSWDAPIEELLYTRCATQREISEALGAPRKSVENAVRRLRLNGSPAADRVIIVRQPAKKRAPKVEPPIDYSAIIVAGVRSRTPLELAWAA